MPGISFIASNDLSLLLAGRKENIFIIAKGIL